MRTPIVTMEQATCREVESPVTEPSQGTLPSKTRLRIGISFGDFLRHGRALALAVLVVAYLGHHANNDSKSFTSLVLFVKQPQKIDSWWVVAYVFIVYTMFGSRQWLVHRSISRITKVTSSAIAQVASTDTMTKIKSSVSMRRMQLFGGHDDAQCGKRTLAISAEVSFVSESHVARMTLRDIRDVFQYVLQCGTVNFNRESFVSKLSEPARKAIGSLDVAVEMSRGERVFIPMNDKNSEFAAVDVLAFAGVCRIFAEWMVIRLVPEGYGRYGFGIGIARRDMIGNISKMERVVHAYLDAKVKEAINGEEVYSPSIRVLLEHEIATNKHPRRPKLGPNTAALGILWLKRQLEYQAAVFSNASEIPYRFSDTKSAGRAAYEEVYGKYHGFIVKQIFQNSFEASPTFAAVLQHINLPKLENILESDDKTVDEYEEDDAWFQLPVEQDSIRSSQSVHPPDPVHPFLKFMGDAIKEHATKFANFFGSCIGHEGHHHASLNALSGPRASLASLRIADKREEAEGEIDKDVAAFLVTIRPFLQGLDSLFEVLLLNDPTRV